MNSQLMILGGAALYVLAMLAVGWWSQRRIHQAADFIVAGRRLPLWLATATLSATWFGGGTILGAGGMAYEEGFLGIIPDPLGAGLCLILAGFYGSANTTLGHIWVLHTGYHHFVFLSYSLLIISCSRNCY